MNKVFNLRKKYPKFVYENFSYEFSKNDLKIVFCFSIEPGIHFKPEFLIKNVSKKIFNNINKNSLDNLVFNLGLIEIPSYWKLTSSPIIEIRAGYLNKNQIQWWKNIFIEGMGQFYYENKIDWRIKNFLKIYSTIKSGPKNLFLGKLKNCYLLPFAGGRDSIVTLENLKRKNKEITLFTVNPIEKIQQTVKISGIKKQIIIKRILDRKLLDLNKKGFLNGHIPFTSMLSFLSVFCAVIFDCKNIAFSNEKSSDEGNVKYLGKVINHQWAKSSVFEKKFKEYSKKYLAKDINYFSFLRKFTEIEISEKFSKYQKYFPVFSSCNAGMKISTKGLLGAEKRWCGKCPKCLFVFLTLYPFVDDKKIIKIFGSNLFEDKNLLPLMKDIVGKGKLKPLECVGTYKESRKAFELSFRKSIKNIPYLLKETRKCLSKK